MSGSVGVHFSLPDHLRQSWERSERPEPPQRRSSVPFELVPREALKPSAGTFAVGVALVLQQAKRRAKKSPGTAAGLCGSALFVLHSRRLAPHIRRKGAALLRLSPGGTTRGSPRPNAAGTFSSGDFSVSTAGLRGAGSAGGPLRCIPCANPTTTRRSQYTRFRRTTSLTVLTSLFRRKP